MYFDGPPPQRTTRQKSSPSRNYVPAYHANGTGRDLMSFYPTMQVLPHTAKVYNAIKPVCWIGRLMKYTPDGDHYPAHDIGHFPVSKVMLQADYSAYITTGKDNLDMVVAIQPSS